MKRQIVEVESRKAFVIWTLVDRDDSEYTMYDTTVHLIQFADDNQLYAASAREITYLYDDTRNYLME